MSKIIYYPPTSSGGGAASSDFFSVLKPSAAVPNAGYWSPFGAGAVLCVAFDIPANCTLQALTWRSGGTSTGNFRIGAYGPSTTHNVADGLPLLVDSGSIACPATFTNKRVDFGSTPLPKGQVWIAITFSSGSQTFQRVSEEFVANTGLMAFFTGAFGALPATLPAMATDDNGVPFFYLEVTRT